LNESYKYTDKNQKTLSTNVSIQVINGPLIENIPWTQGMNAQKAMESAHNLGPNQFTYLLQYYGSLGYLVSMINETYETFPWPSSPGVSPCPSSPGPYYYWEFLVNNLPSQTGIDNTTLNPGDLITFELAVYNPNTASSTVKAKHMRRTKHTG
jgi:hypothetical protein